jgi:ABC-type methionine transport system permease subunit
MQGGQISLFVGIIATLVSLLIGVTYGAIAGYAGGRVDDVMMRFVDVLYSLPYVIVVIVLLSMFRSQTARGQLVLLFISLGSVSWLTMARIVRGQVLSLKNQEFVLAARATGVSNAKIIFRHLVPNTLGPVIVYATLTIPQIMLTEAFLSYLGFGVQAPLASWVAWLPMACRTSPSFLATYFSGRDHGAHFVLAELFRRRFTRRTRSPDENGFSFCRMTQKQRKTPRSKRTTYLLRTRTMVSLRRRRNLVCTESRRNDSVS